MKKQWQVTVDGVPHTIEYKAGFGRKMIVDGQVYKLKSSNFFLNVIDYSIDIGGAQIQLVVIGNKADLAINGTYLGSGQPYQPTSNTPVWVWVLVGLSIMGGWPICGIFGICIGCLFSILYVKNGIMKKTGIVIVTFILCTIVQFMLRYLLATALVATGYYSSFYF